VIQAVFCTVESRRGCNNRVSKTEAVVKIWTVIDYVRTEKGVRINPTKHWLGKFTYGKDEVEQATTL